MNSEEKLDYLIGQFSLIRGELAARRITVQTGSADPTAVTAALAFLGTNGPSAEQIAEWSRSHTLEAILTAVDAYLAPCKAEATHPSSGLQPGQDWREKAAFFAAVRSKDLWASLFNMVTDAPLPADHLPNVFDALGGVENEASLARLVPEVIDRAEAGYTYAGNHVTPETLARNREALDVADPGWVDERLRRVLVLTSSPISSRMKDITLERWLWIQWRTSRPNTASPFWDGAR